jgi:iron-sulfur cluster repair protein YtfE (RIC family)
MIRQPALQSLSHDHHQALAVALKLARANADNVTRARQEFLRFWQAEGQAHFRLEEEILLPAYAELGNEKDPLIDQVLRDHLAIRRRVTRVERGVDEPLWAVRELGGQLAEHVRLEERQLFPRIEELLPPAELERLAAAFARAEDGRDDRSR